MATSNSSDSSRAEAWRAGASVYSGREDPEWDIDEGLAHRLLGLWERLKPWAGKPPKPPGLGYRGVFVSFGDGARFVVYGGAVWFESRGKILIRRDPGRRFERLILESAPSDTLPPFVAAELSRG